MKAFTFQAPPNILFEAGASKKLAELVAGYGAKRVLLVTDKGVRNAGLTKNAEAGLIAGGCERGLVLLIAHRALPEAVLKDMMRRNRNVRVHTIPDCGHAPALIADDQIEIVTKFLGGNDPDAG